MHTIDIIDYKYKDRVAQLGEYFDANPSTDCDEHSIEFDNHKGKGTIRGINFDHGVSVMLLEVNLKQDLTLNYDLGRRHPILFLYNMKGDVTLQSGENITHDLVHHEAIIYAPQGDHPYKMVLKANTDIKLIFADVVRFLFLSKVHCDLNTLPKPLESMFQDTVGKEAFYFKSSSEPIVVNNLTNLFVRNNHGLERKLLIEANSLKLITSLIKSFNVESEVDGSLYRFSNNDIDALNKAKNYIIQHLDKTPTVKQLSQETGMNTNKLQKGFNMLFGKSIRQFTISFKMHSALSMLDSGDYTISQVAYHIGYTNKGHFSQLFKKEFGLLPSEYISRIPRSPRRSQI